MDEVENSLEIRLSDLRDGSVASLTQEVPAALLEAEEDELRFEGSVFLKGEAYLAGDELIIAFQADASARMPCVICQEEAEVKIHAAHATYVIPVEEISQGSYTVLPLLREAVLLELPCTAECVGGCPERKELAPYMQSSRKEIDVEGRYQPFAGLSDQEIK